MKKILLSRSIFTVFCCFLIQFCTAQDYFIECQVIGSSGISSQIDEIYIAGTIGETVTATLRNTNDNIVITQGFHQPECSRAELVNIRDILNPFQLKIHGNPIANVLTFEAFVPSEMHSVEVTNLLGQTLKTTIPFQNYQHNQIDCSSLSSGYYLLSLTNIHSKEQLTVPFVVSK